MFDFAQWEKMNADKGGELENRVLEIRRDPCEPTRFEAIIVVLAELGKNPTQTAIILGIEEHTVHNYHSRIRKKKGISKEEEPEFDMLFRQRRS